MSALEQAQFVAQLCRVFLPCGSKGVVAVLTAYIDESGTDGGRPFTTVAGYVASPAEWQTLTDRWCRSLSSWNLREWKHSDWLARSNGYKGWGDDDCALAFEELARILDECVRFGISISVRPDQYRAQVRAALKPQRSKKFRSPYRDPYFWCFQGVVESILQSEKRAPDERCAIVCDEYGSEAIGLKVFKGVVGMLGVESLFPAFGHSKSVDFPPLQAADMLASVSRRASEAMVVNGSPDEGWELKRLADSTRMYVGYFGAESLAKIVAKARAMSGQTMFQAKEP